MDFAPLIERVLAAAGRELTLAELIGRIDALDKSIPTLGELNSGFARLRRPPGTAEVYQEALADNQRMFAEYLRRSGISPEREQQAIRYREPMGKHDT